MREGDVVGVHWLDSGLRLPGSDLATAKEAQLHVAIAYGEVVHVDENVVVLAHDIGPDDHGDFCVIWRACVRDVVYYKAKEDEVDRIVREVESQEQPPVKGWESSTFEGGAWPVDGHCL